jgi:hypothetical protein
MRRLSLAGVAMLALGLAACSTPTTPEEVCAAEADKDPTVQRLMFDDMANPSRDMELRPQIADARRHAKELCLRKLGLAPPGGVQRPVKY